MMGAVFFAIVSVLLAFLAGVTLASGDMEATALAAALSLVCLSGCVIKTFEYGNSQNKIGRRTATIKCKTGDCPYRLKTNADSTRGWVPAATNSP